MQHKPAVVYDMDGVIVHSNPAHKKAINIFCERHNQQVSDEFMHNKLYGRTNKEWILELFGEMSDAKLSSLADEKEQIFRDLFDPKQHVVPGLFEFIQSLRREDIKQMVATSAPRENADYVLNELGIASFFDDVLDSSHVNKGKPHPEVYEKSIQLLHVPARHCVVFEDSLSGVEAALMAGTTVVGVETTHTKDELADCHLSIKDFTEITVDTMYGLL